MYKKLLAAAAISVCFSGAALADTLNFSNPIGSAEYTTAGVVSFVNPGSAGPISGGYFGDFIACVSCTTMDNFTSASTNFPVLSLTEGANSLLVTLSSVVFQFANGNADLTVLGSGTANNDGVLQAISFNMTIQGGPGVQESYSGTITTTPLPGTWALLLTALLGLGMFAYRGSKKQPQALSFA
jgi:hypothetical protein